jgi:AraC family transcriptional regulator, transcriptional activator of pobA
MFAQAKRNFNRLKCIIVNSKLKNQKVFTLINPQDCNLAFKIYSFNDSSYFDHLQRLNYFSIIWVQKGNGKLKADFSTYEFDEGTIFSFSPYQPFMFESKNLQGVSLNFHPDFFCIHKHQKDVSCNGILFNNIYDPPFVKVDDEAILQLQMLIEQMASEMEKPELAQYDILISYLKIFLINLSRIKSAEIASVEKTIETSKEPQLLQGLKEAIETNYRKLHSASDYADLLNISPKALAKAAKNYFNKTISDLIAERIIIEAKRELYLTSKSVKEIAYELGYQDEYYFSRFFKKHAEISPQIYRDTVGFAKAEM